MADALARFAARLIPGLLVFGVLSCSSPNEVTVLQNSYTDEEIAWFTEIALEIEYGSANFIKKWQKDVRIKVEGNPTPADLETLSQVIDELSNLIRPINIFRVDTEPAITLYLVPRAEFKSYLPQYIEGNDGFFYVYWNGKKELSSGTILVTSENRITQLERSHLIREELTQALGLMNDSLKYPKSIFYKGWTDVQEFTALDRSIIKMLYLPEVKAGMKKEDVVPLFSASVKS